MADWDLRSSNGSVSSRGSAKSKKSKKSKASKEGPYVIFTVNGEEQISRGKTFRTAIKRYAERASVDLPFRAVHEGVEYSVTESPSGGFTVKVATPGKKHAHDKVLHKYTFISFGRNVSSRGYSVADALKEYYDDISHEMPTSVVVDGRRYKLRILPSGGVGVNITPL